MLTSLSGYIWTAIPRHAVRLQSALTTVREIFSGDVSGFETETELAVHALELRMPSKEIDTAYKERPAGSTSKLRTWRDGARILMLIARLIKDERPFQFFGILGAILALIAAVLSIPLVVTFLETGLVPRFPTAILVVGLLVLGMLSFMSGLILDMTTRTRREMKRLFYLSIPALSPRCPNEQ